MRHESAVPGAITQLILNLVEGSPIKLIDGENKKRCFTDIRDGIEALYPHYRNAGNRCDACEIHHHWQSRRIEASIEELGEMLLASFENIRCAITSPPFAGFRVVEVAATTAKDIRM